MAIDFEALISKHAGEDGSIPAASFSKVAQAISSAVGKEFIPKERYNAKLEELENLKADKAKVDDDLTTATKWKEKFEKEHKAFEDFKADTDAKARLNDTKSAYRAMLKHDVGISDKYIDTVMEATKFDGMKVGEDGKLEKADELKAAAEQKWAEFKAKAETKGADVANPPSTNAPAKRTREEIMQIKDSGERQKAIAENHELFGF